MAYKTWPPGKTTRKRQSSSTPLGLGNNGLSSITHTHTGQMNIKTPKCVQFSQMSVLLIIDKNRIK